MEASKKTVPDAGGNQQAGHWGMLRFFYYEDTHLCCALHCSALLFRRALGLTLPLGPSLTRFEARVNIDFFLSIRNGIRHDSSHRRTSQDVAKRDAPPLGRKNGQLRRLGYARRVLVERRPGCGT